MSRIKTRKLKPSFCVIVEGKTEKWYFDKMKEHINEKYSQLLHIKPEIPKKISLEEIEEFIIDKSNNDYDKVFWIVDLDKIISDGKIEKFTSLKQKLEKKNILVIVNNPCLEYWFLLHFQYTVTASINCNYIEKQLKKHLKDYEKTQRYFTKDNDDIYLKLKEYIETAIQNSQNTGKFDHSNPKKTLSEMYLFFEVLKNEFNINFT